MKMNKFIGILAMIIAMSAASDLVAQGRRDSRTDAVRSSSTTKSGGRAVSTNENRNVQPAKPAPAAKPASKPAPAPKVNSAVKKRGDVHTSTKNKNLKPKHIAPSANYHKMPVRGAAVSKSKAVKKSQLIKHHSGVYYYKKGVYYKHVGDKYIVSRPPMGARVSVLPEPRVLWVANRQYHYYYGTFYVMRGNEYEVVAPPVGAIVESIPEGYEKLEIDGNTYYIVDGVQYKAVVYDGEIWYEVIKVD
ncbi:MAG: DUF6515 family protein [Paludibacteraceae bacterium]|nr:DUF6515 family protein [Paludibacteraceae bacterium]